MIVPRQPKAGGSVTFQGEVALGIPDIIDSELDGDIQPLYDLINGNLDDDNINANFTGRKIQYRKLDLAGQLQPGDFAGPIDATTIIAPGSIHQAQLAPGASIQAAQSVVGANVNVTPGIETVIAELTWTTRGSLFMAMGTVNGYVIPQASGVGILRSRLYLDSSAAGHPDGNVAAETTQVAGIEGVPGITGGGFPLSTHLMCVNGFGSGTKRLQLSVFVTPGAAGIVLAVSNPTVLVWEGA